MEMRNYKIEGVETQLGSSGQTSITFWNNAVRTANRNYRRC